MLLLLDSSGNYLVAGLAESGRGVVTGVAHPSGSPESRNLSTVVETLLESAGRPQLTGVLAGTGPGTFIGTRMAVSYANGLAAAAGIPLAGVNSLAAFAAVRPTGTAVLRDARQEHVYLYLADGEERATELVPVVELGDHLRSHSASQAVVESARPGDLKGARRVAEIAAALDGIVPVQHVELVPLEGILRCGESGKTAAYIEPEYIRGFL